MNGELPSAGEVKSDAVVNIKVCFALAYANIEVV